MPLTNPLIIPLKNGLNNIGHGDLIECGNHVLGQNRPQIDEFAFLLENAQIHDLDVEVLLVLRSLHHADLPDTESVVGEYGLLGLGVGDYAGGTAKGKGSFADLFEEEGLPIDEALDDFG